MRRSAAILLALGVVAGCGSGGDGSITSPRAATTPTGPQVTDAPPRPAEPVTKSTLVAALGDSITEGAPLWSSNPEIRRQYADQINSQSQYEYWASRRLGPKVRFRNCGVSGQLTAQIAQRFDACTSGADVLIVQGGINDLAKGGNVQEAAANLRAMVRKGKALGLRVAVTELLPWNNGHPDFDDDIRRLNARIQSLARAEKVSVIRWYDVLQDPRKPGVMRPELTVEGDHPTVLGYKLLGERVELPR